jgi:hypothetical protein
MLKQEHQTEAIVRYGEGRPTGSQLIDCVKGAALLPSPEHFLNSGRRYTRDILNGMQREIPVIHLIRQVPALELAFKGIRGYSRCFV